MMRSPFLRVLFYVSFCSFTRFVLIIGIPFFALFFLVLHSHRIFPISATIIFADRVILIPVLFNSEFYAHLANVKISIRHLLVYVKLSYWLIAVTFAANFVSNDDLWIDGIPSRG